MNNPQMLSHRVSEPHTYVVNNAKDLRLKMTRGHPHEPGDGGSHGLALLRGWLRGAGAWPRAGAPHAGVPSGPHCARAGQCYPVGTALDAQGAELSLCPRVMGSSGLFPPSTLKSPSISLCTVIRSMEVLQRPWRWLLLAQWCFGFDFTTLGCLRASCNAELDDPLLHCLLSPGSWGWY